MLVGKFTKVGRVGNSSWGDSLLEGSGPRTRVRLRCQEVPHTRITSPFPPPLNLIGVSATFRSTLRLFFFCIGIIFKFLKIFPSDPYRTLSIEIIYQGYIFPGFLKEMRRGQILAGYAVELLRSHLFFDLYLNTNHLPNMISILKYKKGVILNGE